MSTFDDHSTTPAPGYLVYLKWEIRSGWVQHAGGSLRYPYRYASDKEFFQPKEGETVWVVACPRWGGDRLPPTLIVRLETTRDCIDLDGPQGAELDPLDLEFRQFGRYLAKSDDQHGEYFPVNNLYNTMMELRFKSGAGLDQCPRCNHEKADPTIPLYLHIPTHLQTVRRLTAADERILSAHAEAVSQGKVFFLSYRRNEADPFVKEFAAALRRMGCAYWLDQEMIRYRPPDEIEETIPDRASGKRQDIPPERLGQYLRDAIQQASHFIAFVTPEYFGRRWIQEELARAAELSQKEGRTIDLIYLSPAGPGGTPEGGSPPPHIAAREWHLESCSEEEKLARLREIAGSFSEPT